MIGLLRALLGGRSETLELRPEDVEWAIDHGYAPIGTTRVIVLDDGQYICEGDDR